ncbi:GNAT family N-acetyltransferase [Natronoarchaeum mannanilyticum]|uniref:N-acetyltransferase domain-containing protein n=1 Tax=Natronoarchaeum mannanilyticum TaxID=926360 RepID=A0AAV3T4W5_9EURY
MSKVRETYEIRQFRQGDADRFATLYEAVFEATPPDEWFDWKYRDNPFVDHVPITVAVDGDGTLVGARPLLALPMAAGSRKFLALQPGDTMVHPDHRRQGLFTRMTERTIERYHDHEAALFFNFPNEKSGPGYRKLGWRDVGEVTTYYRIQSPGAWLDAGSIPDAAADLIADGYNRVRDALATAPDDVAVERYEEIPAELVASQYRSRIPDGFHANRSVRYLRWRFRNPEWTYRTYVARDACERPIGAAVVGTQIDGGRTIAKLTDVVPPTAGRRELAALLSAALSDHDGADTIAAPACLPRDVLSQVGFHPDTAPTLSLASTTMNHVARPATVDADDWTLFGRSVTDADNWALTFGEQDTS